MSHFARRAFGGAAVALLAALGAGFPAAVTAGAAVSHAQINGSGSSWAANAVDQWIADVSSKFGYQVSFTSTGSAQGRKDFAYKTTDYGVSDISYQGKDPLTGDVDSSLGRQYAYLPIVAGGTSFPYNLSYAGQRIRNLRLSSATLAKIFTNKIPYWDDPAIEADNTGATKLALPHIPIIAVVHSEGSGSTYQFTRYLATESATKAIWTGFNSGQDSPTEYFPTQKPQIAQNGSDGVVNFITSGAGNGTIGFDEYSYALNANFPVAKILNSANYYTAPTQYNDAVALTKAQINLNPSDPNYLTQNLDNVYTNPAPQTYPLSSYSYMVVPTGANGAETKTASTAQRQTIADFLYYSICQGQAEMGPIGYSPLPLFLVQAGFAQISKLKQADAGVDLTARDVTTCNNPTFDPKSLQLNKLAEIAPLPPACDQAGAGPCGAGVGLVTTNPGSNGAVANSSGSGSGSSVKGGSGSTASGKIAKGASNSTSGSAGAGSGQGQFGDTSSGTTGGDSSGIVGVPTNLASATSPQGLSAALYVLIVLGLIVVIVAPVLLSQYWSKQGRGPQ